MERLFHETLGEQPGGGVQWCLRLALVGEEVRAWQRGKQAGAHQPTTRLHNEACGAVPRWEGAAQVCVATALNFGGTPDLVPWTFNSRSHLVYPFDFSEMTAKKWRSLPIKATSGYHIWELFSLSFLFRNNCPFPPLITIRSFSRASGPTQHFSFLCQLNGIFMSFLM